MTPTRDPRLIAYGIVLTITTAALVWLGWTRGGVWQFAWLAAFLTAMFGAGELADGATKRNRDTENKTTEPKESS